MSDAAITKPARDGGADASAAPGAQLGELNDGVPLPVKNTFIDGSGLTPRSSPKKDALRTAPAQVNLTPGFVQRSLLTLGSQPPAVPEASPSEYPDVAHAAEEPVGELPSAEVIGGSSRRPKPATLNLPGSSGGISGPSPSKKNSGVGVVQRPGYYNTINQDWPLMTPSPTGSSMFAAARYQLFGGPAPVQEATYALGPPMQPPPPAGPPVGLEHRPGLPGVLATQGPVGAHVPVPAQQARVPVVPLTVGASTLATNPPGQQAAPAREARLEGAPGQSAAAPPGVAPVPPPSVAPPAAPTEAATAPAAAATPPPAAAAPPAPLARVEQEGSDEEDDSENEQQQQQQSGRSPEDAPKPPPGALHPSMGSENHAEGTCKRCCFFPRNRCNNGYDCEFCHYEHEKRKRKNKKSKKKNKAKAEAAAAEADGADPGSPGISSVGDATTPGKPGGVDTPGGGNPDVWSAAYPGAAAVDPLFAQQPPPPPVTPQVVVYDNDGSPQWTYQWIDDARPFPGQFPEPPRPNYYGAGLPPPQAVPGTAADLGPVLPLYAQPPLLHPYDAAQHWASPPRGAYPSPPFPGHAPGRPDSQPSTPGSALAPPPLQAPNLPEGVSPGMMPPPSGLPTLPPTMDAPGHIPDGQPPPPAGSPRLSDNVLQSLRGQDMRPAPIDTPY